MFVGRDDGGGGSEEDGSGFVRVAAWWCFALSSLFYACLVFVVFTVDIFADRRPLLLVAGLIIYLPAVAIWLLTRWFTSRR